MKVLPAGGALGIQAALLLAVCAGCGASGTEGGPKAGAPAPAECCADEPEGPAAAMAAESPAPAIPDVLLTDQDGRRHRFYTDVLAGKLVVMNAIYTTCAGTCPMQTSIFAGLQKRLGERVGGDVRMVSLSLDPVTDTPRAMKAFAERYHAGPGWLFLTGPKRDVDRALEAMGLDAPRPEDHTPIAVIGNEKTGVWMKVINLTSPVELLRKLEYVASLDRDDLASR